LAELADTEEGREALLDELLQGTHDPHTVPRESLRNPRRLARAAEILRLTGKPPWMHRSRSAGACRKDAAEFVILPSMAVLKPRIEARTAAMLDGGWVEETRELLAEGLLETPTARQALGYSRIADFLNTPGDTVESLKTAVIGQTVRYARRQRTWFANQHPDAHVIRPTEELAQSSDCARAIAENILHALSESTRPA
jgi:tRNA dimethylallyltransferase